MPRRQSKQEEAERLAKDRIDDAAHIARRVPPQGKRRPIVHHGGASYGRNSKGTDKCRDAQDRLDREIYRLAAEDDFMVPRQIILMSPLEHPECSQKKHK